MRMMMGDDDGGCGWRGMKGDDDDGCVCDGVMVPVGRGPGGGLCVWEGWSGVGKGCVLGVERGWGV